MRFILLFIIMEIFSIFLQPPHCQQQINRQVSIIDTLIIKGRFEEAITLLRPFVANEITDSDSVRAWCYTQYGICLGRLDNTDSSIIYLKKAAKIWDSRHDKRNLYINYTEMGSMLSYKTNYQESVGYYKDALSYAPLPKDSLTVYIRLCALLSNNNRSFDSAFYIVENDISRYSFLTDKEVKYKTYYVELTKGLYYQSKEEYHLAIQHLENAVAAPVPSSMYLASALLLTAETLGKVKEFTTAFRYADSARRIVQQTKINESWLQIYDLYRFLYEATGNIDSALFYANKGRTLSDTLYQEEQANALMDASHKYKNDKLSAENKLAENEKKLAENGKTQALRSFYYTIGALCLVALLAFLAFRNASIRKKANHLLTKQKQQVEQLAHQLAIANDTKARLFSTIGHDLRSPVSSLYASLKLQEIKGMEGDSSMSEHTIRLLDTLEELLIWSKSQMEGFTIQPVKIYVPDLLKDLQTFYATAANAKGLTITCQSSSKLVIYADENLLKTILRNAISNAITNTPSGNVIQLIAAPDANGAVGITVSNPCTEDSFLRFQASFHEAAIKSGTHGLGMVLIKEFAQKLGASIRLNYTAGNALLNISI